LYQLKCNRSLEESESELDNDLYDFDASLSLDNVDCDDIDADAIKNIYDYEDLQESNMIALLEDSTVDQVQLESAMDGVKESDHDLIVAVESVEIPQSVDDRLMVSSPLTATDTLIETLPETESYGEIVPLETEVNCSESALVSKMESNNEISKVGLADNDLLQGYQVANPNTHNDHHLKNIIETGEIEESVGYSGTPCPTPFTYRQPTNYCRYLQRRRTRQRHQP